MSADIFLPFKLCGCNHFVSSLSCPGNILSKMIMISLEKIKLEHFFGLTTKDYWCSQTWKNLIHGPWVQMILSCCGWAAFSLSLKYVSFLMSSISHWISLYYLHDNVTGVWRWSRHLLRAFIKNNVFRTTGMQGVWVFFCQNLVPWLCSSLKQPVENTISTTGMRSLQSLQLPTDRHRQLFWLEHTSRSQISWFGNSVGQNVACFSPITWNVCFLVRQSLKSS